jgi:threonine aldolase
MNVIDLRSDTVTRPSAPMRKAMAEAEVGDDVFGEDPTVNRLQETIAVMFGKEAGLFVPSGVMGNEVSIKTHTQPGDEVIVEQDAHIAVYETAAPAVLSSVLLRTLPGMNGVLTADQIKSALRYKAYYMPRTSLICLENTHGRSGGTIYPIEELRAIGSLAAAEGMRVHLDGARIWNASVATGISLKEYASCADSVSVCLSKGLGAPVGSVILGSRAFIERARTYRKMFGGGMRQAGVLAAAGLYAIENNIARLEEDHRKARTFVQLIAGVSSFTIDRSSVQTNMVIAEIHNPNLTQQSVLHALQSKGVLLTPERSKGIRAVMHLDVSIEDVRRAADIIISTFE